MELQNLLIYSSLASETTLLNWWCETPGEFATSIYNFTSEVYFVGKLYPESVLNRRLGFGGP